MKDVCTCVQEVRGCVKDACAVRSLEGLTVEHKPKARSNNGVVRGEPDPECRVDAAEGAQVGYGGTYTGVAVLTETSDVSAGVCVPGMYVYVGRGGRNVVC